MSVDIKNSALTELHVGPVSPRRDWYEIRVGIAVSWRNWVSLLISTALISLTAAAPGQRRRRLTVPSCSEVRVRREGINLSGAQLRDALPWGRRSTSEQGP